jgi:hypothetical protein
VSAFYVNYGSPPDLTAAFRGENTYFRWNIPCGFDRVPVSDVFSASAVEDGVKGWLGTREGRMSIARYMVAFSDLVSHTSVYLCKMCTIH